MLQAVCPSTLPSLDGTVCPLSAWCTHRVGGRGRVKSLTQGLIPLSFTLMDDRFPVVRVGEEYLSYQKTGKGKPLFCLHGWAGHERTFDGILPFFNPHFRIYQLAWPGFGSARLRRGRYSLDDMVRWVDRFREHFGFRKIYLMGNCIGANVALEYAYQHRERLKALIINEPHGFMPAYFYLLIYPVIGDVLLRALFKIPPGRSLIMSMFPLEDEEGTGYTERRLAEVPTSSMAAFLRAMYLYARETNAYARPKIKVPTIFPLPQKTFVQVAVFERLYGRCFTNLEVAPVEGEVHNPVVEDPHAFARAVLPHLGIRK
ncbi:hypothetical protein CEE36_01950 [candidate division TA06 bacterium B3_TA06]|uniref:AB hydrolase-1 domain-containing protein n=1 Tax=candidate division TA06 bacterium B3_TA06 TaxID=2012487 RepID=A0A532V9S4_UNCT6|nr:MAG: hypothetical protein CEE36_01950 [candidate division TA06 bacterium B3_TA06]